MMLVDPREYPNVEGDLDEYSVMIRLNPSKLDSQCLQLRRGFKTQKDAEEYAARYRDDTVSGWDRFERYNKLKTLRADGPLDYAVMPPHTKEQVTSLYTASTAKMSSKRLGMPYFAAMRKDNCLEVYMFTMEDFLASDWRTA